MSMRSGTLRIAIAGSATDDNPLAAIALDFPFRAMLGCLSPYASRAERTASPPQSTTCARTSIEDTCELALLAFAAFAIGEPRLKSSWL
jgi:hypothetical protein